MSTAIASLRPHGAFVLREANPPTQPQVAALSPQASTRADVEGITPVSADRSDLIRGLEITDQRLLLNQYQVLNQQIQRLMDRQPAPTENTAQQPGSKSPPSSLVRFWIDPRPGEANPASSQNRLLAIHRHMLSTLAALRVEDGTLTAAAKALIDTAFEHPTLAERERALKDGERPGVYPLKLDKPRPDGSLLAGAFLITSNDGSSTTRRYANPDSDRTLQPSEQRGLTVLYTPRDGYEAFDSPAQALQTLRQRIADDPGAAQQLKQSLALAAQRRLKSGWENELSQTLTPLPTDVIAAGLPQLLEQLEQGADLWPHFDGGHALWARNEQLLERLSNLDARQTLNQQWEDRRNWHYLAQQLDQAAQRLPETATQREVSAALKSAPMNVASGSAHYLSYILEAGKAVTLEAFINENGLPLPKTLNELLQLSHTATARAQQHPFGNFGGGLSWPIPLTASEQQLLRATAIEQASQDADSEQKSPIQGVLAYLSRDQRLSSTLLEDPVKLLEALVTSTQGQALGQAAQAKLKGITTDASVNDYTLAAIQLVLDPASITTPQRNRVAGFDLADPKYRYQPPSVVVESLCQYLIDKERLSPALAKAATYALLMRVAPQLLVKNMPDTLRYGSQAWANLCIAVAAIEALSPGSAATMTFAEVMVAAAGLGAAPAAAQTAALVDWGVANNLLDAKDDALYTQADIDKVQAAFTHQQEKLKEGATLQDTLMPDRRQMALALLKQTFGDAVPLEDRLFSRLSETIPPKPGKPYSMLDIVMEQRQMDSRWAIKEGTQGVDLQAFIAFTQSPAFNIQEAFDQAFTAATDNHKTIKKLSIINALTNLPPEDKKALSTGQLKYYQEKSYRVSKLPFVGPTLFHTSPKILVTAQNGSTLSKYEFDTEKGIIKNIGNRPVPRAPEYVSDEVSKVEEFFPDTDKRKTVEGLRTFASYLPVNPALGWVDTDSYKRDRLDEQQPSIASAPYMFVNPRTHHIADSIIKALDLDNPAIRKAAAGTTSSEHRGEQTRTLRNAFLDLIPFRSAIVNFRDGNYSEGINDVAFDIFGFITAGVGAAAKAGKVLGSTGSALNKALKVTKIMVAPLLKELNPLGGAGDLFLGAGKMLYEGGDAARSGLRTLKGGADRDGLIAAGKRYDAAAIGHFKVGEQTVKGFAIQQNDQWYAYDAVAQKAYGSPKEFDPQNTLSPQSPKITQTYAPRDRSSHRQRPYDISARPRLQAEHKPLPSGNYVENTQGKLVREHFKRDSPIKSEAMDKFAREMNDTYAAFKQASADPQVIPTLEGTVTVPELFEKAFEEASGVVLGESHNQTASFRLLFNSIETLKRQNVKKVYFEGLIDMPDGLYDDGIGMLGRSRKPRTDPTFEELKKALEDNAIEVLPLDHYYLTRHKDNAGYLQSGQVGYDSVRRLKEMNYFASETIFANSGTERWVALVGYSHMNTSEGVPGLAELTNSIGIGVFDNPSVVKSYGLKSTERIPDPEKAVGVEDIPGDLQIYVGKYFDV